MKEEIQQTEDFLYQISNNIHNYLLNNISEEWLVLVFVKCLLLAGILLFIDFTLKFLAQMILSRFSNEEKFPIPKAFHTSKMSHSIVHFITLLFAELAIRALFQYRHPETFAFFETILNTAVVITIGNLAFRFLKAVENYYLYKKDYYRIVAMNALSQTLKSIGIFIFTLVVISVLFGIKSTTILGSIGAITAVLVLVFRDTILGFMTGIHVATSKNLKVGDMINIPKYNLEGNIKEISLITTKIENFDKTISTIPTYDLLSTEIKNVQVIFEKNTRRIKRSIYFNIKSFQFLDEEHYNKLSKINLVKDYLDSKRTEVFENRKQLTNGEMLINGQQLTNIGVFRIYVLNYLKANKNIKQNEHLMVRQLENTPQGMPLELYCFTNDSTWVNYEQIQADIFDHLLVASKEFDLEIMQFNKM
ncbi:MAG: mechanosensitive ion channel [Bergeyella zoohelcum]|nr:mechanosensitive ion channel [Bergeyella zoohelcum]